MEKKPTALLPYHAPEITIVSFDSADIVTSSGFIGWSGPDSDSGGWT